MAAASNCAFGFQRDGVEFTTTKMLPQLCVRTFVAGSSAAVVVGAIGARLSAVEKAEFVFVLRIIHLPALWRASYAGLLRSGSGTDASRERIPRWYVEIAG